MEKRTGINHSKPVPLGMGKGDSGYRASFWGGENVTKIGL